MTAKPRFALALALISVLAIAAGVAGLWPAPDAAGPGTGPGAESGPALAARGVVTEIIDGDTLRLRPTARVPGTQGARPAAGSLRVADDGTLEVRLVGLQAPKLPLGRPGFAAWPLGGAARAALERLAQGRELALEYHGRPVDRHGRLLAHLHGPGDTWIQGEMLEAGMARVYSFADNRARIAEMLARERAARADSRGIWAHPFYRVRTPEETEGDIGSFQIVEGRVAAADVVRGRGYLNFGADWRTDFTVSLDPAARRLFESEGFPVESYEGRRVRVRGWIDSWNGPMIEATHPEQIEVLAE